VTAGGAKKSAFGSVNRRSDPTRNRQRAWSSYTAFGDDKAADRLVQGPSQAPRIFAARIIDKSYHTGGRPLSGIGRRRRGVAANTGAGRNLRAAAGATTDEALDQPFAEPAAAGVSRRPPAHSAPTGGAQENVIGAPSRPV